VGAAELIATLLEFFIFPKDTYDSQNDGRPQNGGGTMWLTEANRQEGSLSDIRDKNRPWPEL